LRRRCRTYTASGIGGDIGEPTGRGQPGEPNGNLVLEDDLIEGPVHRLRVYGVKVAGGAVRSIWVEPARKIYWLGIAEAGQQLVTNTGAFNYSFTLIPPFLDGGNSRARGTCTFNFVDAAGQRTEPAIPVGPECYYGGGTIAPIKWARP